MCEPSEIFWQDTVIGVDLAEQVSPKIPVDANGRPILWIQLSLPEGTYKMKTKLRRFSLLTFAVSGLLFSSAQPADAFDFLARRAGSMNAAAQKGVHQKGATQKGVHQKGVHQKGVYQKGVHQKGVGKNTPHQKQWRSHHKGASQKGGKGKGSVGTFHEAFDGTPDAGAPLPEPIAPTTSAWLLR